MSDNDRSPPNRRLGLSCDDHRSRLIRECPLLYTTLQHSFEPKETRRSVRYRANPYLAGPLGWEWLVSRAVIRAHHAQSVTMRSDNRLDRWGRDPDPDKDRRVLVSVVPAPSPQCRLLRQWRLRRRRASARAHDGWRSCVRRCLRPSTYCVPPDRSSESSEIAVYGLAS